MSDQIKISRQNIFVVAFFILLAGLLSLLFALLEPFLRSFLWATILVMVFYPLYSWLLKITRGHTSVAAFISTLLVLGFLALPGFFIVLNLGRELPRAYNFLSSEQWDEKSQWVVAKLQTFHVGSWFEQWGLDNNQSEVVMQKQITDALRNFSHLVLQKVSEAFANLGGFLLQLALVCIALFFFFRDGPRLAMKGVEFLPMEKQHRQKVVHTLSVTVTAVVRAIFLTALIQGFMAGLGFVVAGVPIPFLLGLVAFVNAFIPFLGAASVWIPVSIWLLFQGQTTAAVGLAIWGIIITAVDSIVKPWIIGSEAKIPLFLLFFTTLGGLKIYGVLGIFLGPIILSMGMAFLTIYREVYLYQKKPMEESRSRG